MRENSAVQESRLAWRQACVNSLHTELKVLWGVSVQREEGQGKEEPGTIRETGRN